MKKAMLGMVLAGGSLFAAPHISVGIGFGAPVAVVRPACPGPGYTWVDSYYAPNGGYVAGYWAAPVVRVAPRYDYPRFVARDRDWDRDRDRRFDRDDRRFDRDRRDFDDHRDFRR
jgi:hypothetical protein